MKNIKSNDNINYLLVPFEDMKYHELNVEPIILNNNAGGEKLGKNELYKNTTSQLFLNKKNSKLDEKSNDINIEKILFGKKKRGGENEYKNNNNTDDIINKEDFKSFFQNANKKNKGSQLIKSSNLKKFLNGNYPNENKNHIVNQKRKVFEKDSSNNSFNYFIKSFYEEKINNKNNEYNNLDKGLSLNESQEKKHKRQFTYKNDFENNLSQYDENTLMMENGFISNDENNDFDGIKNSENRIFKDEKSFKSQSQNFQEFKNEKDSYPEDINEIKIESNCMSYKSNYDNDKYRSNKQIEALKKNYPLIGDNLNQHGRVLRDRTKIKKKEEDVISVRSMNSKNGRVKSPVSQNHLNSGKIPNLDLKNYIKGLVESYIKNQEKENKNYVHFVLKKYHYDILEKKAFPNLIKKIGKTRINTKSDSKVEKTEKRGRKPKAPKISLERKHELNLRLQYIKDNNNFKRKFKEMFKINQSNSEYNLNLETISSEKFLELEKLTNDIILECQDDNKNKNNNNNNEDAKSVISNDFVINNVIKPENKKKAFYDESDSFSSSLSDSSKSRYYILVNYI